MNQEKINSPQKFSKNEENGRVETIETSVGNFVIFYNIHGGFFPDEPLPAKYMEGVDALILENMGISRKSLRSAGKG